MDSGSLYSQNPKACKIKEQKQKCLVRKNTAPSPGVPKLRTFKGILQLLFSTADEWRLTVAEAPQFTLKFTRGSLDPFPAQNDAAFLK